MYQFLLTELDLLATESDSFLFLMHVCHISLLLKAYILACMLVYIPAFSSW